MNFEVLVLFLTRTHAAWEEKKVINRMETIVILTEAIKEEGYRMFELVHMDFIFAKIIPQFSGHAIGYWVMEKASLAELIIKIIKGNIKTRKTTAVINSKLKSFLSFIIVSPPLSSY